MALTRIVVFAVLLMSGLGCASASLSQMRRAPAPSGVATRFAELRLPPGADCVVALTDGTMLRGDVLAIESDTLRLIPREPAGGGPRAIAEADITWVARVTGKSKAARGWIGAGIGAVASLPLSISMVGDAMLVGAIVGSLIGRATGDAHLEVVLQRNNGAARRPQ